MNEDIRILGVDPGEKRIGLAVSDLSGTIANPLQVILHVQREADARAILAIAEAQGVKRIVVGQALGAENEITPSARKAGRLAEALQALTAIPVVLWDESGSTNTAREARRVMGARRKQRRGHMDDLAATVILQSYLDAHRDEIQPQGFAGTEK